MHSFSFEAAPRIICEQGGASRLGQSVTEMSVKHLFLATDEGLVKAGLMARAIASLTAAGIAVTVFSDVLADPPQEQILPAVDAARVAQADGVAGFGGGSSLDTAELVALRSRQDSPDNYGVGLARDPRLPLLQLPATTS